MDRRIGAVILLIAAMWMTIVPAWADDGAPPQALPAAGADGDTPQDGGSPQAGPAGDAGGPAATGSAEGGASADAGGPTQGATADDGAALGADPAGRAAPGAGPEAEAAPAGPGGAADADGTGAAPADGFASASSADASAAADVPVAEGAQLAPVPVTDKSYFTLRQAFIFQSKRGRTASVTVTLHNGDSKELKAADFWIKLQNRSGDRYEADLTAADKDKNAIAPKADEDFTFLAPVGDDTRLSDLVVTVFRWDFDSADFEKDLGTFAIPDDYDSATPAFSASVLKVSGEPLKTYVERPQILKGAADQLITAALQMENKGNHGIAVPNYKFALLTSDGTMYSMEPDAMNNAQIQPQARRTVIVSGSIPAGVEIEGGDLLVFLTDDGSKIDYPVADYRLPDIAAGDALLTPAGTALPVNIDGVPVNTWVDKVTTSQYVDKRQVSFSYNWENKSNVAVNVPDYGFMLRTQDGSTYPIAVDGWKGVTVRPKEKKELLLSVILPGDIAPDGMALIVYKANPNGNDKKLIFPVALYQVEAAKNAGTADRLASFTNTAGMYQVRVTQLQRLPWEDEDQITVDLLVENPSDASLPIPKLDAYFLLDGVAKVSARVVQMDENLLLASGGSTNLMVLGNVPYGNAFKEVKLVLQEKTGDIVSDLTEFNLTSGYFSAPPVVGAGDAYSFEDSGRKANVKIYDIRSYSSEYATKDIYYVELEVENAEKRFNNVTKWAGYFKTDNDLYFPANISDFSQKLSPGGKVLLAFWSQLPKGYTWDRLQLLIGEAVTGNRLTPVTPDAGDDNKDAPKPDGFVKAVLFNVPGEAAPKSGHKDLRIGPYTLSLSRILASASKVNEMQLTFDYDLQKNTDFDASLDGHKFVIEFKSGEFAFTEEIELEKGSGGKVLQLGTDTYQLKKTVSDLDVSLVSNAEYTIRLYDQFQGQRRLLAEEKLPWDSASD